MHLTREENEMLAGKHGFPAQKSMKMLIGLGECYDAEKMIPVTSAHLLYSLTELGKGGVRFLQDMANRGGKFIINTHTNPLSFDPWLWKDFGISEEYAREQMALTSTIAKMGAFLSHTCTPYLIGHVPLMREHAAWSESSAIVFANSILGARTNREGGPSALSAAIAGRVPEYGYHLDQNRCGDLKIVVTARLESPHDYGTLGYFTGKIVGDKVPVFIGIPPNVSWDALKLLGAAAATSGSVALYHVVGVTPEAPTQEAAFGRKKIRGWQTLEFGERELRETEESLSKATTSEIDLVVFGCPHASITELGEIARLLSGKRLKSGVEVWIATSRVVKTYAEMMGYINIIEASGAKVICDACPVAMSRELLKDMRPRTVATNSAKLTYYIAMYAAKGQDVLPYYGSLGRCIEAATTGKWRW